MGRDNIVASSFTYCSCPPDNCLLSASLTRPVCQVRNTVALHASPHIRVCAEAPRATSSILLFTEVWVPPVDALHTREARGHYFRLHGSHRDLSLSSQLIRSWDSRLHNVVRINENHFAPARTLSPLSKFWSLYHDDPCKAEDYSWSDTPMRHSTGSGRPTYLGTTSRYL